ncbi:pyruvate dehydrogenase (acetyl-transferring) kinase, mitochondrial [Tanacetum coccineum]|uniref:Pyruvate dehydrogenase (Acetyl-transferring) kinase, mitochondrial n=1 Tax=Tanacetum coccineum TaxID=301880 RepID=A0ABQ5BJA8_9ASTR
MGVNYWSKHEQRTRATMDRRTADEYSSSRFKGDAQLILFYNGLGIPTRQILDSKAIQEQLNNLGREIKKVNEKVYAAQVGCEQCKGPHYTKDCPLKEEGKTLKKLTIRNLVDLFKEGDIEQQLRDSIKGTTHEENSNLIKEIRALTDAAIQSQGATINFGNSNRPNKQVQGGEKRIWKST